MPQAIKLTDAEGRPAVYVPITQDGKVVDSQGFCLVQTTNKPFGPSMARQIIDPFKGSKTSV